MGNSSLVNYEKISPNRNSPRNNTVKYIVPHCVVGQASVESLGNLFAKPSRQASSNYGIGSDGRVGLYCPESDRSWCSSSAWLDNQAITIENASDNYYPYAFNWVVYMKLVDLCVDICKRYGKTKILWFGNKKDTFDYVPKSNEMVFALHRWMASTACPGDWLVERMDDLTSRINAKLGDRNYLMKGDKGEAVKTMQTMLIAVGYSCGASGVDGSFGADTESALKKFQKAKGLTVDGLYGVKSKEALTQAYIDKGKEPSKDVLYYVQCGAFKQLKNAEAQVKNLKAKGFSAFVKQLGTIYKVQCGAYKTKKNAEALVAKLKAAGFTAIVTN